MQAKRSIIPAMFVPARGDQKFVWGAHVAEQEMRKAILRKLDRMVLIDNKLREDSGPPAHPGATTVNEHAAVREAFDVLHMTHSSLSGLLLREATGRPFPITFYHYTFSYPKPTGSAFLLADIRPYDTFIALSAAAGIALRRILDETARWLRETHGVVKQLPEFVHIPLGVDTARFRPDTKAHAREMVGIPPDRTVLLAVGRISSADKMDLVPLLRVLPDVRAACPNVLLVIAASNYMDQEQREPLEIAIRDLGIADAVSFTPFLEPDTFHAVFAAADVFVSIADNLQEAFGLTPVEAMASGVPQVVSDWNGYRDSVVDGETGFLVPTYWIDADADLAPLAYNTPWANDHFSLAQSTIVDLGALRNALTCLCTNPDLRAKMAAASRKRALALFDWSVVVDRYIELWSHLMERAAATTGAASGAGTTKSSAPPWRYTHLFANYPTRLFRDGRLGLTPYGHGICEGRHPFVVNVPEYACPGGEELQASILQMLREHDSLTIAAIVERLTGKAHESWVRRACAQLAKLGVADLTEMA